jgi:hypothetical protein
MRAVNRFWCGVFELHAIGGVRIDRKRRCFPFIMFRVRMTAFMKDISETAPD